MGKGFTAIRGQALKRLRRHLSMKRRMALDLLLFGMLKVPLLGYVRPRVVEASSEQVVIKITLRRRTRNHLGSMYFGVLAAGADCAGGIIAMEAIAEQNRPIAMVFKDFTAQFLKRAEGDVFFSCTEGQAIRRLVAKAAASSAREELPVRVDATVPRQFGAEPVATFVLTLSLKGIG